MNSIDLDKLLSDTTTHPEWIIMNPSVWNGYWDTKSIPSYIRHPFRLLGKLLRNKYLYWIGLPIYWVDGLKLYYPDAYVSIELINIEDAHEN